jgi:type II secretory pathway predicted ATPase ExeA
MKHLPPAILDDRCAFVGTSGSGKTVAAKTMVEDLLDTGARVGIVDPMPIRLTPTPARPILMGRR